MNYLFLRSLLVFFSICSMSNHFSQIVINEIMTSPSGGVPTNSLFNDSDPSGNAEWIELYNLDPCNPVDISCFTIASNINDANNKASFTFPAGTMIPPGGYLVIGGDNATNVDINIGAPAYASNRCGYSRWFLRDTHGYLVLFDDTGVIIDGVYWSANGAGALATVNELNNTGFSSTCSCSGNLAIPAASAVPSIAYAGQTSSGLSLARAVDGTGAWGDRVNPTAGACNFGCSNPLVLSGSSSNEYCSGADGMVSVNVSGGTPPYTYSWTNSGAPVGVTQTVVGLSSGTYKVVVTDNSSGGCGALKDSLDIVVSNDGTCCSNSLTATTGSTDNTVCGGASPPCTYSGSPLIINEIAQKPGTSTTDKTIQSIKECAIPANGQEYIEIFNPNPCQALDISCYIIATSSYSSKTNGSFRFPSGTTVPPLGFVSIGGPNSGATFDMSTYCGNGHLVTGHDRWYLDNGDAYTAIYDDSGNLINAVFWTTDGDASKWGSDSDLDQDPAYVPTPGGCPATTLEATYTIPLSDYRIEHAGQSATLGNSLARTSDSSRTWGDVAPSINSANGAPLPPFSGGGGSCDGTATVTPSGGSGSYSYAWDAAAGSQTGQTATALCAGCYEVTITDNVSGCTFVETVCVQDASGITLDTSVTGVTCNSQGAIDVTVNETPLGAYSYDWNNGAYSVEDINNLTSGTYNLQVTNTSTNCVATISVPVDSIPGVSGFANGTDVTVGGGSDGTVSATGVDGTPTYTYSWTGPGGPYVGQTITGLSAGCYDVTITDALTPVPCTYTEQVCITEPPCSLTLSGIDKPACFGGTNGEATVTVSGGTGTYSYAWTGGDANGQTTNPAVNLSPVSGVYNVLVTDLGNPTCQANLTIDVSESPEITVVTDSTAESCPPGSNDGVVQLTSVMGGYPAYEFSIDTGNTMVTTPVFSNLSSKTHEILIQDEHLCQKTVTINVDAPSGCGCLDPLVLTSDSTNNTICGASVSGSPLISTCNGTATVTVQSGGTSPYTYQWDDPLNQTTATADSLCPGSYTVTVTDSSGDCVETLTIQVLDDTYDTTYIATVQDATCGNSDGEIIIEPQGTGNYSYVWTPNVSSNDTASNLGSNSYDVQVSNDFCLWDTTIFISEGIKPQPYFTIRDESCEGVNDGAIIIDSVVGGTAPYTFLWQDASSGDSINNLNPDSTFTLVITDSDPLNCSWDSTFNISVGPLCCLNPFTLDSAFTANTQCLNGGCNGEAIVSINSGGTAPYSYQWDDQSLQVLDTAKLLCAGSYKCIVTDSAGCVDSATVTVTGITRLSFSISKSDPSCGTVNDGEIIFSGLTPSTNYDVSYTDPSGSIVGPSTITTDLNGDYTVSLLDSGSYSNFKVSDNVCPDSITTPQLLTRPGLSATIDSIAPTCSEQGDIIVSNIVGTPPFNISAVGYLNTRSTSTSQGSATIGDVVNDTYTVTVTSADAGCQVVGNLSFNAIPNASIDSIVAIRNGCNNVGDITVYPNIFEDYNLIELGQVNQSGNFQNIPIGTYNIEVKSANLCPDTMEVTITPPVQPIADFYFNPGNVIYNDQVPASSINTSISADSLVWYINSIEQGAKSDEIVVLSSQYEETQAINVCLKAIDKASMCEDSTCQNLVINERCIIYVPNSFTPNDDGLNDRFFVSLNCYEKFRMIIFDRWGEILYESNNPFEGWSGEDKNGIKYANGVYGYRINVTNNDNSDSIRREGSVTLIR